MSFTERRIRRRDIPRRSAVRAGVAGLTIVPWLVLAGSGQTPPSPDAIEAWDLWLGPAPYRPYHPAHIPVTGRPWWDFGNGRLGDMGCHLIDLPFWALDLKYPETVEAEAACRVLGARAVFTGQIDGATEINAKRYDQFAKLLTDLGPDIAFTHWAIDSHRDHRVASVLTYDAWRRAGKRFALYYYEVMSGAQTPHFHPTHYVDITQTERRKHEATYCPASQHPDGIWAHHDLMSRFRGVECRRKFAEAFVRHVQSSDDPVV